MHIQELQNIAARRRADAVTMIARAKTGHTGGAMSCLDILTCLFYEVMETGDHFLLSKGHSVEGYWAILADKGYFPREALRTFSQAGSPLIGHPNNKVPGVEMSTGSLGHGLPVGVGAALAAKRLGRPGRAFVVMGDGEQAEGSVWEAAMAGANYKLDNLYAIIDRNGLQISGNTESVIGARGLSRQVARVRLGRGGIGRQRPVPTRFVFQNPARVRQAPLPDRENRQGKGPCRLRKTRWNGIIMCPARNS